MTQDFKEPGMSDIRRQREIAERLLEPHFPNGARPFDLLRGIISELGKAELRGYDECLSVMEPGPGMENSNDN